MANNLTGDFEAVVQLAVRQINGLLATLHQNGAADDAPLQLLHSASLRIGDPPRPNDVSVFGDWITEYQTAQPPVDIHKLRAQLTEMAPPGAATRFTDIFGQLEEVVIPPTVIHGGAKLQLSSVTLSLPDGSTSEVTVDVQVRGAYTPDPNTDDLPTPIHGEVQAVFDVRTTPGATGSRLLITPSAQDSKIQFIAAPGSGLSPGDAGKISAQVVHAIRESFVLVPVDLPSEFPFVDFKGVGSGAGQAVALPVQLSGGAPPAGGLQNIVTPFIGTAGFAVGIGREYVTSVFQPTIDSLLQFTQDFTVSIPFWFDPTYHFSVTNVDLQFNDKTIDLIIRGKATTGNFGFSSYNDIVIQQRFALAILFDTLMILPDFAPNVSGLPDVAAGAVKDAVVAERDQALPPAQQALNERLADALTRLNGALHSFSPTASASFRAGSSLDAISATSGGIAITPDGVVIRGDIVPGTTPMAPVVEITEIERGRGTAR